MMPNYHVWWPALEREQDGNSIAADSAEEAVELYCDDAEGRGHFADGYPEREAFHVRLADGSEQVFEVETEFEPSFSVSPITRER